MPVWGRVTHLQLLFLTWRYTGKYRILGARGLWGMGWPSYLAVQMTLLWWVTVLEVLKTIISIEEGRNDTWFINRWSKNKVPYFFPHFTCREKETLTICELQFEGVNDFNYLVAGINSENKVDEKITMSIMAGNCAYFSLRKVHRSHLLC
jgi:hypothetical protein